jgi:astacin
MPCKTLRYTCALLCSVFFAIAPSATAQQVRQGIYRGMPVSYVVNHGRAIFQGDIVLEKVEPIDPQRPLPSFGVDYAQYLWPKVGNQYQIPYVIASGSGNLSNLNTAITQFNNTFPNIQFVAHATQTDYVNFYFDPSNNSGQCEAIVGRAGGVQQVGGAGGTSNPCAVGTILHEMGHTVGLWHEQSRPDRNNYVSVNYNNLIKGSISNFNQIYDNSQQTTLFDYASIMQYPAFAFSRNGGPAIESIPAGIPLSNLTGYTAADIDGIERLLSLRRPPHLHSNSQLRLAFHWMAIRSRRNLHFSTADCDRRSSRHRGLQHRCDATYSHQPEPGRGRSRRT